MYDEDPVRNARIAEAFRLVWASPMMTQMLSPYYCILHIHAVTQGQHALEGHTHVMVSDNLPQLARQLPRNPEDTGILLIQTIGPLTDPANQAVLLSTMRQYSIVTWALKECLDYIEEQSDFSV